MSTQDEINRLDRKCAKCEQKAERIHGASVLCGKHSRFRTMMHGAKTRGKAVPTYSQLEELVPSEMKCPCCGVKMDWFRVKNGMPFVTLQHDRDGGFKLICMTCNIRHYHFPQDTFYDAFGVLGHCGRCGQLKPLKEFALDRSTRSGKKAWCKLCSVNLAKQWYLDHKEMVLKRDKKRRNEYRTVNKEAP